MTALKVDADVELKRKANEPVSFQIFDCFEDYFPRNIEQHVRELNQTYPLATLHSQIDRGEITEGQWMLYTTVCLSGQTMNGGVEGFLGNCPGLVRDVPLLLQRLNIPEFLACYRTAVAVPLRIIEEYAANDANTFGDDLNDFWNAYNNAYEQIDAAAGQKIEEMAYVSDRETDPGNWFRQMEARALDFVLNNPDQFRRS